MIGATIIINLYNINNNNNDTNETLIIIMVVAVVTMVVVSVVHGANNRVIMRAAVCGAAALFSFGEFNKPPLPLPPYVTNGVQQLLLQRRTTFTCFNLASQLALQSARADIHERSSIYGAAAF